MVSVYQELPVIVQHQAYLAGKSIGPVIEWLVHCNILRRHA